MRTIFLNHEDMNNPNKALIVLSKNFVETRYNLSLPTQRLLFNLISKITYEERKQGVFLNTLEFTFEELKIFFEKTGRKKDYNLLSLLKNVVNELDNNSISIQATSKYGHINWRSVSWKDECEYNDGKEIFRFKFNQTLAPFLLELKNYYKSDLDEYLKLSKKYSIKLYILFRSTSFGKNKISFDLDDFKKKLDIEDKYQRWDVIKSSILDNSIKELNKETNYFFEYETERIGRSIGRVIIYCYDKTDDRACTRFVRKTIENFLKRKKIQSTTISVFKNLSFSFDKEKEIIYVRFKDKKSLEDFLNSQKSIKTESEAYIIIDKAFGSYGLFELLKTLFRKKIHLKFSSVNYVKKVTPKKTITAKPVQKEEEEKKGYVDMYTLDLLEQEAKGEQRISNDDIKPIKAFGFTVSQAEKVFLFEGNQKIKDRAIRLLKNGVSKLDVPKELIKEYEKESVL